MKSYCCYAAAGTVAGLAVTAGVGYVLLLLGGPLLHNIIDDDL